MFFLFREPTEPLKHVKIDFVKEIHQLERKKQANQNVCDLGCTWYFISQILNKTNCNIIPIGHICFPFDVFSSNIGWIRLENWMLSLFPPCHFKPKHSTNMIETLGGMQNVNIVWTGHLSYEHKWLDAGLKVTERKYLWH